MGLYTGNISVGAHADGTIHDLTIDSRFLASSLESIGSVAVKNLTMYWSVADRNSLMVPFSGEILINRLMWITLAVIGLIVTQNRFSFNVIRSSGGKRKPVESPKHKTHIRIKSPDISARYGFISNIYKTYRLSWFYALSLFKEVSFIAIILSGLALLVSEAFHIGFQFGHVVFPTTYNVIKMLTLFELFFIIILVFSQANSSGKNETLNSTRYTILYPYPTWWQQLASFSDLLSPMLFDPVTNYNGGDHPDSLWILQY